MFTKFALLSKEMNFFGVLSLIAGLRLADFQWVIDIMPEAISTPVACAILFVVGLCGMILRYFFTDGKVSFNKDSITSQSQALLLQELSGLVKTGTDIDLLKAAATKLAEQKELETLQAQFNRLEELKAKVV